MKAQTIDVEQATGRILSFLRLNLASSIARRSPIDYPLTDSDPGRELIYEKRSHFKNRPDLTECPTIW